MTEDNEQDGPRVKFLATIGELAYGEATEDFDAELTGIIDACLLHRKKGEFQVTLTVIPDTNPESTQVVIEYAYKAKLPQRDHTKTIMYSQPDGSLSRRDPRQAPLPWDMVQSPQRDAVDPGTGEVPLDQPIEHEQEEANG